MFDIPIEALVTAGLFGAIAFEATGFRDLPQERPERVLVRAARAGDSQAFEELMRDHSAALRRFLGQKVSPSEVEDLVQDTWIAAWESIKRYDGRSRFRTWLFAICQYKIRDYWRARMARVQAEETLPFDLNAGYLPAEFDRMETRELLRDAWIELSQEQREVLDLYYFGGLTLAEVGKVLGRNINTVKYQFYRGHERVASKLVPIEAGRNGYV